MKTLKITLIGAGSYRTLGILRGAMNVPGVLDGGEINLYDRNPVRAEVIGRLLMKSPEYRRARPTIKWGTTLEEALDGATAVGVIMPAMSPKQFYYSTEACVRHGFLSSDNVSSTGAFCAINIAPVLLDIARKMERHCPDAWFLNFVNPAAALSGMINLHTKIKALGLCQGFTNHLSDIPRLCGCDEDALDIDVTTAGINHLSFVTSGTWNGRDVFEILREKITPEWQKPALRDMWTESDKANITNSMNRLVRFWRELGVLVFSSEHDGMDHLMFDEAIEKQEHEFKPKSAAELDGELQKKAVLREESDKSFRAYVDQDLNDAFWATQPDKDMRLMRVDGDVFIRVFKVLAGQGEVKLTASRPNNGVIAGIKDRHIVECTQTFSRDGFRPVTEQLQVPDVVHGLVASMANHQTMLADALGTQDPKLLAHALLAYPFHAFTRKAKAVNRDLIAVNAEGMTPALRKAVDYL